MTYDAPIAYDAPVRYDGEQVTTLTLHGHVTAIDVAPDATGTTVTVRIED